MPLPPPQPMDDPLPATPRDPEESFTSASEPLNESLADFWTWGYSQLLDNAQRGVLAEYIVGLALGCTKDRIRANWEAYDLLYQGRYGIEVKSSAYLQAWKQKSFSPIDFSIGEHLIWDSSLGWVGEGKSRPASIYVFCVFTEKSRSQANPLNLDQWDFYVVSTERLVAAVGDQKRIRLSPLIERVKPRKCSFNDLRDAVDAELSEAP